MFEKLPWDIIRKILLYNPRYIMRNDIKNQYLIYVGVIPKEDIRYSILSKIPRIYQMAENQWTVILSEPITKKRFVLGYRCNYNTQWEYLFHTFSYNHILRIFTEDDSKVSIR